MVVVIYGGDGMVAMVHVSVAGANRELPGPHELSHWLARDGKGQK